MQIRDGSAEKDDQPSVTMKLVTSQPHFLLKYVTMLPLNLNSNHLVGSIFTGRSANADDGACVDIRARGFWNVSCNDLLG